jgi:hypothetical protein
MANPFIPIELKVKNVTVDTNAIEAGLENKLDAAFNRAIRGISKISGKELGVAFAQDLSRGFDIGLSDGIQDAFKSSFSAGFAQVRREGKANLASLAKELSSVLGKAQVLDTSGLGLSAQVLGSLHAGRETLLEMRAGAKATADAMLTLTNSTGLTANEQKRLRVEIGRSLKLTEEYDALLGRVDDALARGNATATAKANQDQNRLNASQREFVALKKRQRDLDREIASIRGSKKPDAFLKADRTIEREAETQFSGSRTNENRAKRFEKENRRLQREIEATEQRANALGQAKGFEKFSRESTRWLKAIPLKGLEGRIRQAEKAVGPLGKKLSTELQEAKTTIDLSARS